jgi:benzoylformate decarboxylase
LSGIAKGIETAASPAHVASAAKRNAELAALKERETQAYRIRAQKAWDREPISMPRAMAEIGRSLPDNAILVDESITATLDMARSIDFADGGSYFGARGGGIGQGLPGAVGVKLAQPSRPVVCVSGDGSAMYSIQALWTAAHLGLGIVFVILANGEYRILKHNIDAYRQRFNIASQAPYAHMDLGSPRLGFIEMAAGMGVAGTRVAKPDEIEAAIRAALGSGGPHVVEIAIEGKR